MPLCLLSLFSHIASQLIVVIIIIAIIYYVPAQKKTDNTMQTFKLCIGLGFVTVANGWSTSICWNEKKKQKHKRKIQTNGFENIKMQYEKNTLTKKKKHFIDEIHSLSYNYICFFELIEFISCRKHFIILFWNNSNVCFRFFFFHFEIQLE